MEIYSQQVECVDVSYTLTVGYCSVPGRLIYCHTGKKERFKINSFQKKCNVIGLQLILTD